MQIRSESIVVMQPKHVDDVLKTLEQLLLFKATFLASVSEFERAYCSINLYLQTKRSFFKFCKYTFI